MLSDTSLTGWGDRKNQNSLGGERVVGSEARGMGCQGNNKGGWGTREKRGGGSPHTKVS